MPPGSCRDFPLILRLVINSNSRNRLASSIIPGNLVLLIITEISLWYRRCFLLSGSRGVRCHPIGQSCLSSEVMVFFFAIGLTLFFIAGRRGCGEYILLFLSRSLFFPDQSEVHGNMMKDVTCAIQYYDTILR